MRLKGYLSIGVVCLFYWILDSIWSYLSFEINLKNLIFREPASYYDTFLLKVPPYQIVSRLMVVSLLLVLGSIIVEFFIRRQRAEKERRDSHDTLLTILNSIDATVYVADIQTHEVLFVNQKMIDRYGEDFTGRIGLDVFGKGSNACGDCSNNRLVDEDGNPTGVVVWEGQDPDTETWCVNYDRAIRWIDGRTVHLQISTDITQIKVLQKKQAQTESQLRQVQKMESIGRLAGGVAHDYNNMLSVIIGYTELAMDKVNPAEPLYEDLEEVFNAATRSADITKQLLAFARQQTIAPKILDINSVVEGMLKMLRRLIGENIDLSWQPGENLWSVKIDPSQINQILANLCVNARDAIADIGKVIIETKNVNFDQNYCAYHFDCIPGEFVMLAVSDNGSGIAQENLDKVFEPFFTTKSHGKGTGLGLATVYGIMKQNDGFVNIYSELEVGTSIKIYLPRHMGEHIETPVEVVSEIPLGRGETVLFVDDDASIMELGKRVLGDLGYTVFPACTPKEALSLIEAHSAEIDLLITDVIMPEMNGRELSGHAQKLCPKIKTLFMSGYTADVIAHRGILDEGVSFIPKPLSKMELAAKVREVLDNIGN